MTVDIARAMKDPGYRQSLTTEDLFSLIKKLSAHIELTATELDCVAAGTDKTKQVALTTVEAIISLLPAARPTGMPTA
jgi:hypothetical protein